MSFDASLLDRVLTHEAQQDAVRAPGYLWTTVEETLMRQTYPAHGPARCAELLPHRGIAAIYAKARCLKLKAPTNGGTHGQRFARKYPINAEVDQIIEAGYRHAKARGDIKAIAARAGRPKWWVHKRAVALGLTILRIRPLEWSRQEMVILEEFGACDVKTIGAKLRAAGFTRTATAIEVQRKRSKIDTSDPDSWTARDLGLLLGVDGATVANWVQRRGLQAERKPWGPNGAYRIKRQGLREWLREHHGYVDLRRVDQPWFWGLVLGGAA